MNAVQNYLKNIGKSVKYATVAYVEKNAPATKEFKETNSELFKDITASIRDYKSTIRRAKDEMENTPIYRQGTYAFENAMSDIRSGKLYNKQREDDAENDFSTFGGGDFGFELDSDFSTGNGTGGSDDTTSSEITMGEKSMLSEIHESSKRSAHRIGSTIEASTRYMVETSKMNANLIYSQNAKMSRSIDNGLKSVTNGIGALYDLNKTTLTNMAENSKTYFETTTNIMQENNAILKEMLEMQRNLYKKENTQSSDQMGSFGIVGTEGTPNLKAYGKEILKNIQSVASDKTMGASDMFLNEDSLRMLASNPLAAIPGFLVATALGPTIKTSMQKLDKTISGVFSTAISRLNYNAKHGDGKSQLLGQIFGIDEHNKNSLNTGVTGKEGPTPFDFETKKSIVEVIPSHLARIEAALTGGPTKVYDMANGRWTTMKDVKANFKNMREASINTASSNEMTEMREMMKSFAMDKETEKKLVDALAKINSKRFDDYGYYDRSGGTDEIANRYGISDKDIARIADKLMQSQTRATKMSSANSFANARYQYNSSLRNMEANGNSINNLLFNGFDARNALLTDTKDVSKAVSAGKGIFDLTAMKDSYGMTIFDYLRDISDNTAGVDLSKRKGKSKGSRISKYHQQLSSQTLNGSAESGDRVNWNNSAASKIKEAASNGKESMPFVRNSEKMTERQMSRIMAHIEQRSKEIQRTNDNDMMAENTTWLGNIINDAANKQKVSAANNSQEARQAKDFTQKLVQASSVGQKFGVIAEGIQKLTMKPADVLTGVMQTADEQIYKAFFTDTNEASPIEHGKKVKGFFGRMSYEMGQTFRKMNGWIDNFILGKDENGKAHPEIWKARIKNTFGIDLDALQKEYAEPIAGGIKKSVSGAVETVKKSLVDTYGMAKTAVGKIKNYADGARNVSKTGLTIVSKGERIIPSDENIYNPELATASRARDRKNEAAIKQRLNKVFDSYIPSKADGDFAYGFSEKAKMKKKAILEKQGLLGSKTNLVAAAKTEDSIASQFMTQIFGNTKDTKKQIAQAEATVKKHLPDAAGGAVVGAVAGGTLIGGPLMGAMLGSAISVASNSETIQKALFGEKVVDAKGNVSRKGGLISAEMQKTIGKYYPDMKTLGISGAVLGMLTPLGPLGGLMVGSAIGFAKNNDSVKKALFGDNGLFNKDTQKILKKAFPAASKGAIAGVVGSMALGVGLFPGAVIGAGLGLVSSTDEFKDFLLGKDDGKGNRVGGLAGAIKETIVGPLAGFANGLKDQFGDWLKYKMFKPVQDAIAPIGKSIELGLRDTIGFMKRGLQSLFDPKTGIPIASQIGWALGTTLKPVVKVGKATGRATAWIASRPSAAIGALGDKLRTSQIKSGNADYMTAQERLKFMGEKDYAHKRVDKQMAGSTIEQLQEMDEQFGLIEKGKGYFDAQERSMKSDTASKIVEYCGGDTGRAANIMKALIAGDTKEAQKYVQSASIDTYRKKTLSKYVNDQGNKLRTLRAKRANYNGDRKALFNNLSKQGFKGINDTNIQKYHSTLSSEIQSRKKAMNENNAKLGIENNVDKMNAAIISGSINDNFANLLPMMQRATSYLQYIAESGGKLTIDQRVDLKKQDLRGRVYATKNNLDNDYVARKRNREIAGKFGSYTNNISAENKYKLLEDKKLYKDLKELSKGGMKIPDINEILSLDEKSRKRYLILAGSGYQIKDVKTVSKMTDTEFNNLKTLAEVGVKITNIDKVKKLDPEDAEVMARLYANGFTRVSQGALEELAKTSGRALLAKGDYGTAKRNMNILALRQYKWYNKDSEEGLHKTNKVAMNRKRFITENYDRNTSSFKRARMKTWDAASGASKAINGKADDMIDNISQNMANAITDKVAAGVYYGLQAELLANPVGAAAGTVYVTSKANNTQGGKDFAMRKRMNYSILERLGQAKNKLFGSKKHIASYADGLENSPYNQLAIVSKGERIESAKTANSAKLKVVDTEYGPQTFRVTTNGSMSLENTKSNKLISIKLKRKDKIQEDILSNLKEIVKMKKDEDKVAKKPTKEKSSWLTKLMGIMALVGGFKKLLDFGKNLSSIFNMLKFGDGLAGIIRNFAIGKVFPGIAKVGGKILTNTRLGRKLGNTKVGKAIGKGLDWLGGIEAPTPPDPNDPNASTIEAINAHDEHMVEMLNHIISLMGGNTHDFGRGGNPPRPDSGNGPGGNHGNGNGGGNPPGGGNGGNGGHGNGGAGGNGNGAGGNPPGGGNGNGGNGGGPGNNGGNPPGNGNNGGAGNGNHGNGAGGNPPGNGNGGNPPGGNGNNPPRPGSGNGPAGNGNGAGGNPPGGNGNPPSPNGNNGNNPPRPGSGNGPAGGNPPTPNGGNGGNNGNHGGNPPSPHPNGGNGGGPNPPSPRRSRFGFLKRGAGLFDTGMDKLAYHAGNISTIAAIAGDAIPQDSMLGKFMNYYDAYTSLRDIGTDVGGGIKDWINARRGGGNPPVPPAGGNGGGPNPPTPNGGGNPPSPTPNGGNGGNPPHPNGGGPTPPAGGNPPTPNGGNGNPPHPNGGGPNPPHPNGPNPPVPPTPAGGSKWKSLAGKAWGAVGYAGAIHGAVRLKDKYDYQFNMTPQQRAEYDRAHADDGIIDKLSEYGDYASLATNGYTLANKLGIVPSAVTGFVDKGYNLIGSKLGALKDRFISPTPTPPGGGPTPPAGGSKWSTGAKILGKTAVAAGGVMAAKDLYNYLTQTKEERYADDLRKKNESIPEKVERYAGNGLETYSAYAGGKMLYNGAKTVGGVIAHPIDSAKALGSNIANGAKSVGSKAINILSNPIDTAKGAATSVKNFGSSALNTAKSAINTISNPISSIKGAASDAASNIADKAGKISGDTKSVVEKISTGFDSVISKAKSIMGGKVAPALEKFKDFMMKKLTSPENLKKIMEKMGKKVAEYATAATGVGFFVAAAAEVGFAAEAFNSGMNNAESLLKIPSGTATTGMKLLCGFTSAILQAIPVVGWILEPEDVMDSVIDIIGPVVGVTQDDLKKIRETGKNEDKGIVETAKDAAKAIKDKVVAGAGSVWDGVKGFGASLYDKASKVAGSVWDTVKGYGSAMYEGLHSLGSRAVDTAKAGVNWVKEKAGNVVDSMKSGYQTAKKAISDTASSAYDYVANSKIGQAASSLWNKATGNSASGKYGRGKDDIASDALNSFHSQLDPINQMGFNTGSDTQTQTMSDSGCGPASAANAAAALGVPMDTKEAAQFALDGGYKEKDGGTRPQFFKDYLGKSGIGTKDLSSPGDVQSSLKSGNPVLLMGKDAHGVSSKNPYGEYNHYVTATGIDSSGNVTVQDPESNIPNKVYKASDLLSKSSMAISAAKGKWGRSKHSVVGRNLEGRSKLPLPSSVTHYSFRKNNGMGKYGRGNDDESDNSSGGDRSPEHMWALANWASGKCNVDAKLIFAQWYHESAGFNSTLARENYNFGGMTQSQPTGDPKDKQPDGGNYYMHFANPEEWAEYYAWYINKCDSPSLAGSTDVATFAQGLKHNGYYGADVSEYTANMNAALDHIPSGEPNMSLVVESNFGKRDPGSPSKSSGKSGSSGSKNGGIFGDVAEIAEILQSGFSIPSASAATPKKTTKSATQKIAEKALKTQDQKIDEAQQKLKDNEPKTENIGKNVLNEDGTIKTSTYSPNTWSTDTNFAFGKHGPSGRSKWGRGKTDIKGITKAFKNPSKSARPVKWGNPSGMGKWGRGVSGSEIYQKLLDRGFSEAAAAGVMGNIQQESTFDPRADNGTHLGLCQWDKGDRWPKLEAYASEHGSDPYDFDTQLDFMTEEAKQRGDFDAVNAESDAGEAANVWNKRYEVSGEVGDDRRANAEAILQSKGANVTGSSSNSKSKGGSSGNSGGIFGAFKGMAKALAGKMQTALGPLASSVTKMAGSFFGNDTIKSLFGDNNPFASIFSSGSKSGDSSKGSNSKGGNFSSSSSDAGIQAASSWAESVINNSSVWYGDRGCTEFVKNYLLKAGNKVGEMMSTSSDPNLMWVPTLAEWAKSQGIWKEASAGGAEGDICVCNDYGHVIIADGKGGAWGNSSGHGCILHYPNIVQAYGEPNGYIATGSGDSSVSSSDTTRSAAERNEDAGPTNNATGKYGLGKFGRARNALRHAIRNVMSKGRGKWGRSVGPVDNIDSSNSLDDIKKSIADIDQSKVASYNQITDSDSLDVARAKAKKIRQLNAKTSDATDNALPSSVLLGDAKSSTATSKSDIQTPADVLGNANKATDSTQSTTANTPKDDTSDKDSDIPMKPSDFKGMKDIVPVHNSDIKTAKGPSAFESQLASTASKSEIPESFVKPYNKIQANDSVEVIRAKMKKNQELWDKHTSTRVDINGKKNSKTLAQAITSSASSIPSDFIKSYNKINPTDSNLVKRMKNKKNKELWDKHIDVKSGNGKWGRGNIPVSPASVLFSYPSGAVDNIDSAKTIDEVRKAISDIDQSNVASYNQISDSDSLDVAKAKAKKIRQLNARKPSIDTSMLPATALFDKKDSTTANNNVLPDSANTKIMNAVDSIQNPSNPEDNLKTMDDIKKYIQDVPDDFIKDYNKIDYTNDSLTVARAKAIKIRQLYDAHLKEAGVTPAESKAAATTIDPNNPTKTDTTDKNAKATNDSVNKATGAVIAQATKPLEEAKKAVDAVVAQATGAAKSTDTTKAATTTTDSTTSTTDYNAKFDTMIQLLSSIASSLATITGAKAPAAATTTTQAGSQTDANNAINASSAQAQTSTLDMNAFTSIAAAMNKLANK